ncbi:MAG: hypothetical protein AUJ12_04980 [Alphaproteobacteria bacterium CG1_02_46_17]|nr:MAG: hypothetical protein AUJ12_04980 [Alphaproteobacteria bacterium CG1_02_46_17]
MSDQNSPQDDIQGFEDPASKFPKWAKYLGGTAVGLVLIAGGVSVLVPHFIDQAKYKKMIVEKVEEKTGYQVDWSGDIGMSLLPLPHVTVNDLSVKANNQEIVTIKSVDVEVALFPLLSKKIEVKDISLDEPKINLVTLKNGQQTWMTSQIGETEKSGTSESSSGSETDEEKSSAMDVSINIIEITDGVLIVDNQKENSRQSIEDIDVRLKADSLSGPFEINGGILLNGHKIEAKINTSDLDIENGIFPVQVKLALPESNLRAEYSGVITNKDKLTIEGDVSAELADIQSTISYFGGETAPKVPAGLEGKANLSAKLVYSPEKVALNNLRLDVGSLEYGGEFSATDLTSPSKSPGIAFSLKSNSKASGEASSLVKFLDDLAISVSGTMKDNKIVIEKSNIKLDENDLSLKGSVALDENKTVDLTANIKKLDLDQIQKKLGLKSDDGKSIDTNVSAADNKGSKEPIGFSVSFTGRIKADVEEVKVSGKSYQNIHLDLTANKSSLTIVKLEAGLPDNVSLKMSGQVGNTEQLSGLDISVQAKMPDAELVARSYNITIPDLPKKIGSASIDGKFTGDLKALGFDVGLGVWDMTARGVGTVANVMDKPVVNKLKFSLQHPNFVDAMHIFQPTFTGSPSLTGPMNVSGNVALGDNQYHISDLKGTLGKTTIDVNMDMAMSPKLSLSGKLKIGDLVLPSTSPASSGRRGAATQSSASSAQGSAGATKWSREAIDVTWMKKFDADLQITANSLSYNLWNFTNANLDFTLSNGNLGIQDMSAGLFGGTASVSGNIKSGTGDRDPLDITAQMKAEKVDARQLQNAFMGSPNDTLSGTISDVNVKIAATGLSPAALVQTLSGDGTVNGENIVVKGVDAAQLADAAKGSYKPLDRAGTLFGSFGKGQTEFTTMNTEFVIQNGIVNFSKILFDGPKAILTSTGYINLPQWTIDLKNNMTVKDTDIPPFDFTIKGPLDNPSKAGGDIINNYLNKKVNKLIENKLGKLLGVEDKQAEPVTVQPDGTTGSPDAVTGTDQPQPTPETKTDSKDALKKEALKALGGLLGQ